MRVTIDKNNTNNIGKKIKENTDNIENDIKKLENVIESINSAWEGADALKYVNSMKEKYVNSLQEFNNILKEYSEYLSNVSGAYSILDETFSSKNINV